MSAEGRESQVITRIGFAERWLHRAKRHYGDGDARRGLLSVVLADAEMRYALETGGMPSQASPHRLLLPALLLAGALAVLAVATTDWLLPPQEASGAAAAPPIFRLTSPVGIWLNLVQTASTAASAPQFQVHRSSMRRPNIRIAPVQPVLSSAVRAGPSVSAPVTPLASVAPVAPPPEPVPMVTARPVVLLSTADLIDLAISADRTLRRVPTP